MDCFVAPLLAMTGASIPVPHAAIAGRRRRGHAVESARAIEIRVSDDVAAAVRRAVVIMAAAIEGELNAGKRGRRLRLDRRCGKERDSGAGEEGDKLAVQNAGRHVSSDLRGWIGRRSAPGQFLLRSTVLLRSMEAQLFASAGSNDAAADRRSARYSRNPFSPRGVVQRWFQAKAGRSSGASQRRMGRSTVTCQMMST